jgi:hypothetical protein
MRIVTYDDGNGPRTGILRNERVVGAWEGDVCLGLNRMGERQSGPEERSG